MSEERKNRREEKLPKDIREILDSMQDEPYREGERRAEMIEARWPVFVEVQDFMRSKFGNDGKPLTASGFNYDCALKSYGGVGGKREDLDKVWIAREWKRSKQGIRLAALTFPFPHNFFLAGKLSLGVDTGIKSPTANLSQAGYNLKENILNGYLDFLEMQIHGPGTYPHDPVRGGFYSTPWPNGNLGFYVVSNIRAKEGVRDVSMVWNEIESIPQLMRDNEDLIKEFIHVSDLYDGVRGRLEDKFGVGGRGNE